MNFHMCCQIALPREFLAADMTLVHDGFLFVLAPGIIIYLMNTYIELKIIILRLYYFIYLIIVSIYFYSIGN